MPVAALHVVVLPTQTAAFPPVIVHVGGEFTVTLRLLAALVPQELPAFTVIVPSCPALPTVTDIEMVPRPDVIDQPVGTVQV